MSIINKYIIFSNMCRFIEPTILVDPPLDAAIMVDEVFGPLLPIITVSFISCKLYTSYSPTKSIFFLPLN